MTQAITSVISGHLSIRGAAQHFRVPNSTLQRRVQEARLRRDDSQLDVSEIRKTIGHPTVLSSEQEKDLVERLKSLSALGFGLTSLSIRRAVYHYATLNKIVTPWSDEKNGRERLVSLFHGTP